MTLKGYVTVAEMAERIGVSETRVRQLILSGQLKAEKIGQYNFISDGEAKRFAAAERPTGRPKKTPSAE